MAEKLKIGLTNTTFFLNPEESVNGGLEIKVSTTSLEPVPCKRIIIKIPYGSGQEALTDSNDFSLTNTDIWSEPEPPFPVEDGFVCLSLENTYGTIEKGYPEVFRLSKIPFIPNESERDKRTVHLIVECYADDSSEGLIQPPVDLPFTLQNQVKDETKRVPFVNYFSVDKLNVEENEILTLSWSVANNKGITINPIFLGDSLQKTPQSKSAIKPIFIEKPTEGQENEILEIRYEIPIKISPDWIEGRLQLKLVQSTQFTLIADNANNIGHSQLQIFLNETTIIDFSIREKNETGIYPYLAPITLDWIFTFKNKIDSDGNVDIGNKVNTGNRAQLLITEFENDGETVLPLDKNSPAPLGRIKTTRVVNLNPLKTHNSFTYYPVRKTIFWLYLSENNNLLIDPKAFTIMTTSASNPIGSIIMLPGNIMPTGWRLCGRKASITREEIPETFNELARVLGQTSNNGTINLPNISNYFPVGAGTHCRLGEHGAPDPLPKHQHYVDPDKKRFKTNVKGEHTHRVSINVGGHWADTGSSGDVAAWTNLKDLRTYNNGNHRHHVDVNIPKTRSSSPVSTAFSRNRPYHYAVNFIIRVS